MSGDEQQKGHTLSGFTVWEARLRNLESRLLLGEAESTAPMRRETEIDGRTSPRNLRIPVDVGRRFQWMWAPKTVRCGQRFRCDVGRTIGLTVISAHTATEGSAWSDQSRENNGRFREACDCLFQLRINFIRDGHNVDKEQTEVHNV